MSNKVTVLVTGAAGQLGQALKLVAASKRAFNFVFFSRQDLNIENAEDVEKMLAQHQGDYLINAAAYTAVDDAENNKDTAYLVNATGTAILASACKRYSVKFIQISTDYVFAGDAHSPYRETDLTGPHTVYGASKLEGELLAVQANPESVIIRTSWVYSQFGKNFVKTMKRLMQEKEELSVVNDQFGSPTNAVDLASAIVAVMEYQEWKPGIYHYCNEGIISWFDFAVAIRDISGFKTLIKPISSHEYPVAARRPSWSALDTSLIRDTFHLSIRNWRIALEDCLQAMD